MLGVKSPKFVTHGRMLKSLSTQLQDAPFYVDQAKRKVFVDFGNSLPIDGNGNLDRGVLDTLFLAVPRNTNPALNCSDDFLWLGNVKYRSPNWYTNTAGVQVFPSYGTFSPQDMGTIKANHWLLLRYYSIYMIIHVTDKINGKHRFGIFFVSI